MSSGTGTVDKFGGVTGASKETTEVGVAPDIANSNFCAFPIFLTCLNPRLIKISSNSGPFIVE